LNHKQLKDLESAQKITKMRKALPSKEQRKFQAYQLYLNSRLTLDQIGAKYDVTRQTIAEWIDGVRIQIDEPAIIEAARKDLIDLTADAIRYYSRAVRRKKVDMVGLIAATNTLKKQKLLSEEIATTTVNVSVVVEKREQQLEAGLVSFGYAINRMVVNGNGPASPENN